MTIYLLKFYFVLFQTFFLIMYFVNLISLLYFVFLIILNRYVIFISFSDCFIDFNPAEWLSYFL